MNSSYSRNASNALNHEKEMKICRFNSVSFRLKFLIWVICYFMIIFRLFMTVFSTFSKWSVYRKGIWMIFVQFMLWHFRVNISIEHWFPFRHSCFSAKIFFEYFYLIVIEMNSREVKNSWILCKINQWERIYEHLSVIYKSFKN